MNICIHICVFCICTHIEIYDIMIDKGGVNMASPAQLKANDKYHNKFDDIKIRVPKGQRDIYKKHAESKGKSLNALLIELIEADMKQGL